MDFTMASQLKAGKLAKESRASQQTTIQKGAGGKPQVGADSMHIAKATTAPKVTSGFTKAHKGDARLAPKAADSFSNDKAPDAGEFESDASPSTADTAAHRQDRIGELQSGEFESAGGTSSADTATHRPDRVGEIQAGEFESNAAPSKADTAAHRSDRVGEIEHYQ